MICVEIIAIIVPQKEVTNKNNHLVYYTNNDICCHDALFRVICFTSMQISIYFNLQFVVVQRRLQPIQINQESRTPFFGSSLCSSQRKSQFA